MADHFQFEAELRTEQGKAAARRMRRNDRVPAIIYGAGQDPQKISMLHKDIHTALGREAVYSHILKIKLQGGSEEQVVLKDIQRHPFKPKIEHVDFLRVNMKDKLTMHVPLHFLGEEEAPGVGEGGVLSKLITDIEIKCLPGDLPEFIELDISTLAMDQSLHLSDLKLPKGVEFAHMETLDEAHDHPVVSIHQPRVNEEAEEAAEAEAAEAEGETAEGEAAEGGDAEKAAEADGADKAKDEPAKE
ncbi:MAG: 50S ribosomal protein L25/general stress protein Ctc [Gammaproteobacteria bacterium]|nr:50S ribosomal protein L25/general stress protein Ctc [Gammaproteobacteria bacterium]MCH9744585.1 50S ribosomal protein L25/general stress protein Ctc [Gammaproteobacteria bacterium]